MTSWDTIVLFNMSWIISGVLTHMTIVDDVIQRGSGMFALVTIVAISVIACNFLFLYKEWKREFGK